MTSIPLTHPILQHALAIIPEAYHTHTWVAGSAVTSFGQHGDVDVWVTNVGGIPLDQIVTGSREMYQASATPGVDDYTHIAFKAIDHPEDGLQIMTSDLSMDDLLARFDLSCHAAALHVLTGEIRQAPGYDPIPIILNYHDAKHSTFRFLKFATRYGNWQGMGQGRTRECAARAFDLRTQEELQAEVRWLGMDRGL